jgi:ribosome maturation factor RimP
MRSLSSAITRIVEELLEPYFQEHPEFELVEIEFVKEGGNRFLRVFVDKEGGIDIEECGKISEYLSARLDEKDPIPDAYFLEVSSPGAERPLKTKRDYERAVGRYVYVKTYEPIDGRKEFEGVLQSYNEQELTIHIGKKMVVIPMPKVAAARLAIEL